MAAGLRVSVERPDAPDVGALIGALNDYLLSLYAPEHCHLLTAEELTAPDVAFFVVREGGRAVGCGALRRIGGGRGEVKRMYTVPEARGRGLGRLVLEAIEAEARRVGLSEMVLETGGEQPAALGLYASAGFMKCGPYLDYVDDGVSIFLKKSIGA
jgi:putative acetyltransferase